MMDAVSLAKDVEEAYNIIDNFAIPAHQKFSVVAFYMGKNFSVIATKMKKALGEKFGEITEENIDATTEANAQYLYTTVDKDKKPMSIKVLTPKIKDIYVDYDRINAVLLSRTRGLDLPILEF